MLLYCKKRKGVWDHLWKWSIFEFHWRQVKHSLQPWYIFVLGLFTRRPLLPSRCSIDPRAMLYLLCIYISIDCQLMVGDSAWIHMSLASAIEFMYFRTRHITTHRPMAYPSWSNQISTLKYLPTSFPFHPFHPNSIVSLYFPSSYQWHDSLEIGCIRALQGYRTCRDEVRGWVNRNCSRNLQFSKWYRRRGWRSIIYHPARISIW
jgi:hypothetical protein